MGKDPRFSARLTTVGPVEPLAAGTLEVPVPPEVGERAIVRLRYILYRMRAGGVLFDFLEEDMRALTPLEQAWIWGRREVIHWQLAKHLEAFTRGGARNQAPPQVQ